MAAYKVIRSIRYVEDMLRDEMLDEDGGAAEAVMKEAAPVAVAKETEVSKGELGTVVKHEKHEDEEVPVAVKKEEEEEEHEPLAVPVKIERDDVSDAPRVPSQQSSAKSSKACACC